MEWISVKDRLPNKEEYDEALIGWFPEHERFYIVGFDSRDMQFYDEDGFTVKPTHFCYPSPPKE